MALCSLFSLNVSAKNSGEKGGAEAQFNARNAEALTWIEFS